MEQYINKNGMRIKTEGFIIEYDLELYERMDDFYIVEENGKHGIVVNDMSWILLPLEYEDISFLSSFDMEGGNYVVWYKLMNSGKFGLFRINYTLDNDLDKIIALLEEVFADCEYDSIEEIGDAIVLSKNGLYRYIKVGSDCDSGDTLSDCYKNILKVSNSAIDDKYICVVSEGKYQIINLEYEPKVVFEADGEPTRDRFLKYLGSDNFVYNDSTKTTLFLNKFSKQIMYDTIEPISISDGFWLRNIANIMASERYGGVGAIDIYGNVLFENEYDSVTYELKLTASKNGEKTEAIIPIGEEYRLYKEDEEQI